MRLEKTTKAICENLEPVGAGALDSLVNNFTFGSVETIGKNKEVYGDDNRYYVGRLIADSAGIYLGVEGIVLGVGTEILGGALDLTGAGAPIGIQLNVAGIGIITGSATVVVNSGANFFQDAKDLSSNIESSDTHSTNDYKYVPNDGKHKGASKGDVSADPFWNNQKAGQKSLNTAYTSTKGNKQLYNIHEGKLVKFQPDNTGGYHAYEVINSATEVPSNVLRQMMKDGLIDKAQYNKFIKNK
ncbi:hypothetical protein ACRFH6_001071 [Listeria monocytogenes]|nr:hypothetical protein [Listeria monocytogenes]EGA5808940.1 hypothetical protein [Listeria monocytogenes]EHD1770943.1 hypothetical protein [Listeria monocytogenes]MCD2218212.1 hypothetical protein [Listeria monocytogenes]